MRRMYSLWDTLIGLFLGMLVAGGYIEWAAAGAPYSPRTLPALLVGIDLATAVMYMLLGGLDDWRKGVYWTAAAVLTAVVTW